MSEHAFHPLANLFPLLEGAEFAAMVEDIRAHGLNEPITLFEGKILDGRNRERACRQAGVEPRYHEMTFGSHAEAVAFVISANIHRRHLAAEQKSALIDELIKANPEESNRKIAKQARVGHPKVARRREQLEAKGDVERCSTSIDTKGRRQPRRRSQKPVPKPEITPAAEDDPAVSADVRKAQYAAGELPSGQVPVGDAPGPAEAANSELPRPAGKGRFSITVRYKYLKVENSELRLQVRRLELKERQLVERVAELEDELGRLNARIAELTANATDLAAD